MAKSVGSGSAALTRRVLAGVAACLGLCTGAVAQTTASGPDVIYSDCTATSNFGAVGGMRAYALASYTCNIGNTNLLWTSGGTPGLAMNAYRLHQGRLMQIGQGWVKTACCAAASNFCGQTCNGAAGSVLGAGCRDSYSASYNGGFTRLVPRSSINGFTGVFTPYSTSNGDAIYKRLQVLQTDLTAANFPGALYWIEGQYASSDDAAAGNAFNNVSYKQVTVDASFNLNVQGTMNVGAAAIMAWRDHGLGIGVPDPSVNIQSAIFGEGQFIVATKVTALPNRKWRYDYAVFNQNSDRSGGSLSVPVPAGVAVSNTGFHGVPYHSGEVYSNTDWTISTSGGAVTFASPQTYAQNPLSNALRWGTMYNFWFETNSAPATGSGPVTLGLFKPGTPTQTVINTKVPGIACVADWDLSGTVDPLDISAFVNAWNGGVNGGTLAGDVDGNGAVDPVDVAMFVNQWFAAATTGGC